MLKDDLRITSRKAASQDWLDLLPPQPDERAIPASVYNVAARCSSRGGRRSTIIRLDPRASGQRLRLILRAARLAADEPGSGPGPGQGGRGAATIVVTIEEASAAGRLDLFARAYGLTGREQELLGLLATGSDTRAMARQMALSEHTIQDHLKSIFTKTGARDRVTVLSRALGTRAGLMK